MESNSTLNLKVNSMNIFLRSSRNRSAVFITVIFWLPVFYCENNIYFCFYSVYTLEFNALLSFDESFRSECIVVAVVETEGW